MNPSKSKYNTNVNIPKLTSSIAIYTVSLYEVMYWNSLSRSIISKNVFKVSGSMKLIAGMTNSNGYRFLNSGSSIHRNIEFVWFLRTVNTLNAWRNAINLTKANKMPMLILKNEYEV